VGLGHIDELVLQGVGIGDPPATKTLSVSAICIERCGIVDSLIGFVEHHCTGIRHFSCFMRSRPNPSLPLNYVSVDQCGVSTILMHGTMTGALRQALKSFGSASLLYLDIHVGIGTSLLQSILVSERIFVHLL
jgi:hypothetical protein